MSNAPVNFKELTVAVLAGGPGSERDVSLASAKGVVGALEGNVGKVVLVDVKGPGFELPEGTDVAFNVIHGTYGEDGTLQSELEERGVKYTGARAVSSKLAFDKIDSKKRFEEKGVATPRWQMVDAKSTQEAPFLPCVAKPPREGSSVGVHLVHTAEEWTAAIEDAGQFSDDVLVEELISGKELTAGVVGGKAMPIVHIQPRSGFYDMKNKYPWMTGDGGTDYFCPADLPEDVTEAVLAEALKAHEALGIEVYSRVDLLLREEDGAFFVLEVNTIPGMTESSLLPKSAGAAGMDYEALCLRIIEDSLV
ncbi:UNVERIFIED_CONTAM: hypothetical protein GTU68_001190 [Idotea baltica]|nr:hypothetical protein [Idotea baltica]